MRKTINIGGKDIEMSASALTPILFKRNFEKDLIKEINNLNKASKEGNVDVELVAQITYEMAKEANPDILPYEGWLEQFEMFDLYEALPEVIELWGLNEKTHSTPRKK